MNYMGIIVCLLCCFLISLLYLLKRKEIISMIGDKSSYVFKDQNNAVDLPVSFLETIIILFISFFFITICSNSSPIYPFNDWVDANCFFTVGKSMLNGLVPYKDLFEQKGPFLYAIYSLAWLISNDTFLGVYFLEIIAAFFYLFFSWKIIRMFLKEHSVTPVLIIALLTYTSLAFKQGGSPEELCLPFLSYSLWIILKLHVFPSQKSTFKYVSLGLAAGCLFWTKYTFMGFYIGFYLWELFNAIRNKQLLPLIKKTLLMFSGFVASSIPWLIYFGVNRAVKDLFEVYFYDNIFLYKNRPTEKITGVVESLFQIPILGKILGAFKNLIMYNPILFIVCLFSIVVFLLHKKEQLSQLFINVMIFTVACLYVGSKSYMYYSLIADILFIPGIILLCSYVRRYHLFNTTSKTLRIIFAAVLLLGAFLTPNKEYLTKDRSDLVQYRFKDIILSDGSNVTLLNYDFLDGGFYTVCNIVPNCKAFCGLNIPNETLKETQDQYAESGLCDYIVTRSKEKDAPAYFALYDCINEYTTIVHGEETTYRLYKLKE